MVNAAAPLKNPASCGDAGFIYNRIKSEIIDKELVHQGIKEICTFNENFLSLLPKERFLEIGVWFGGSAKCWEILGFQEGFGVDITNKVRVKFDIPYTLIVGDSSQPATLEKVKTEIELESIDFLFIDGNHSYYNCRADMEMYSQFVRPGGVIAFHDIIMLDIMRFFDEIKDSYINPQKIIDGHNGIGCFIKR